MGKVLKLNEINKFIKPYSSVSAGGFFDLLHVGHVRFLKKCSKFKYPLIVSIMSDKYVKSMKGLGRPIQNQNDRAEIVASLGFVDYTVIMNLPSYDFKYLNILKPKIYIFSKENLEFRLDKKREIENKYPKTKVVFLPIQSKKISTSLLEQNIIKNELKKLRDPIKFEVYKTAAQSNIEIGNVGTLIIYKNKIIAKACNTNKEHAEMRALKIAKRKKIPLSKCKVYSTIPPCKLCAEKIVQHKIKEVYYMDTCFKGEGLKFLEKNNIKILKYN